MYLLLICTVVVCGCFEDQICLYRSPWFLTQFSQYLATMRTNGVFYLPRAFARTRLSPHSSMMTHAHAQHLVNGVHLFPGPWGSAPPANENFFSVLVDCTGSSVTPFFPSGINDTTYYPTPSNCSADTIADGDDDGRNLAPGNWSRAVHCSHSGLDRVPAPLPADVTVMYAFSFLFFKP